MVDRLGDDFKFYIITFDRILETKKLIRVFNITNGFKYQKPLSCICLRNNRQ